jgi:pyridoxal-phosphate dependent TrpB-like enzyme
VRIDLEAKDVPSKWYNILPDLEFDVPPPMGSSGYPLSHHDLSQVASSAIIGHELEREKREVPIPKQVSALYSNWRPTPLYRAKKLEDSLGTPAQIFYKYEGASPSGGHEMNTAIPQAYYATLDDGVKRLVTATANGEWGISLAIACNYFGLQCKVYMVRSSYEQKAHGRYVMEILGAEVVASPSDETGIGKKLLAREPASRGSLSIALSEAFEEARSRDDTKFSWGTVMNHVLLHQTIIGLEARLQLKRVGAKPDLRISSVGGGSGFGGLVFPFYPDREGTTRMIAVETVAAPSLSRGQYAYDYGDAEGLSPLLKMYTLGHSFVPPGIRAGGMGYHGISPLISALYSEKQIEARSYTQREALEAGVAFARAEGMIPSPECSYAVRAVLDEALECKEKKTRKNILFLLDANSNIDLATFKDFVDGAVEDQPFLDGAVQAALSRLPKVPAH